MSIIARFGRREGKGRKQLIKHGAKHRMGRTKRQHAVTHSGNAITIATPQEKQNPFPEAPFGGVKDTKNSADQTTGQLSPIVEIDNATASVVQNEVMDLLDLNSKSNHSWTIIEMANALAMNEKCLQSHSKNNEKRHGFFGKLRVTLDWGKSSSRTNSRGMGDSRFLGGFFSRKTKDEESMKSRYEWINALNRLQKFPSSRDRFISTWEEAKESLEEVFRFPPLSLLAEDQAQSIETSQTQIISSIEKELETLEVSPNRKYKQVESYPVAERFTDDGKDKREEEEILKTLKKKESIDKADVHFNLRIRTAEDVVNELQKSEAMRELEERRIAIEARKRAASLMRALNDDERQIVESAIHGYGNGNEIIAQVGADSVLRASMQTLKPATWLNDEIIHYFYLMLAKRDEELCNNDPSRKRSHFFKSFFITKLLNEGNASCDGKYEYRNVKRWSKKVPGKDIFNLDKILFPINMGNMHWICAAIFMTEKRIQIYDSMGSGGSRYLDALFNYIQDEHMDKKKSPLPDADSWQLVPTQQDTPRQMNGYDCGVFTCMFADFLSKDTPLVFNQEHINQCRERIALSIMNGKAIM